jgi:SnoaL-like polyketide cyclase
MKIFRSHLAIAGMILLVSCNSDQSSGGSVDSAIPMINTSLRNQQTAMLTIEAFNSHRVGEILKDWDSSATDYGDGSNRPIEGLDSLKQLYAFILKAFPNLRVDSLKTLSDNGEHVIVTAIWSGFVKSDSLHIPETKFNFWNGDFFTFNRYGKIVQHKSIQSHLGILAQMGLLDKLRSPEKLR